MRRRKPGTSRISIWQSKAGWCWLFTRTRSQGVARATRPRCRGAQWLDERRCAQRPGLAAHRRETGLGVRGPQCDGLAVGRRTRRGASRERVVLDVVGLVAGGVFRDACTCRIARSGALRDCGVPCRRSSTWRRTVACDSWDHLPGAGVTMDARVLFPLARLVEHGPPPGCDGNSPLPEIYVRLLCERGVEHSDTERWASGSGGCQRQGDEGLLGWEGLVGGLGAVHGCIVERPP